MINEVEDRTKEFEPSKSNSPRFTKKSTQRRRQLLRGVSKSSSSKNLSKKAQYYSWKQKKNSGSAEFEKKGSTEIKEELAKVVFFDIANEASVIMNRFA